MDCDTDSITSSVEDQKVTSVIAIIDTAIEWFLTSTKEGTEEKRIKISPLLPDRRHGRIDLFDLGFLFDYSTINR
eukprot:scaffold110490_cov75-Cyclotella_meneghiniana.AAC.2